jgi:multidrug efflux pump subunit AcrB
MPPGTVPPFIMRFDAGSVPVGYLVFESKLPIGEIQDKALNVVRPMFAALPGVSAPPPFGGNQKTVVIHADPERLRAYDLSPDDVVGAIATGNQISPSGNVTIGDRAPMVPINSVVEKPKELENIVLRPGGSPTVYLRDVGWVEVSTDVPTGYGLVNGKRSVYILVTKRADASTLSVVQAVKDNLPKMQAAIPEDISVRFDFVQSPYVERALRGVGLEAALGAVLTGLMVLLFLRDWRSVLVVVLNIPLALLGSIVALWLTGQTINLMTLGGLALAVGILVDEATVEVENIHTQMGKAKTIARAVRLGNAETAVPRLLAMLCILAVFLPALAMQGAARALFVPLSLAVGFAMVTSYLLSSTFVPVLSTWLLRHYHPDEHAGRGWFSFTGVQDAYAWVLRGVVRWRWPLLAGYLAGAVLLVVWWAIDHPGVGTEIFPEVDSGQFVLRLRAPDGTPLERTEALARDVLDEIGRTVGPDNVTISVSLVGTASYNYPINSIYLWTSGPQEAVLRIALKQGSGIRVAELQERLRAELPRLERKQSPALKDVKLSFEAGDIVGQVMSFGSPTPIEVTVNGLNLAANRTYAEKLRAQLEKIAVPAGESDPAARRGKPLRDLQYLQSLDYPTLSVEVDREKAGLAGVTAADVANSLAPATLSSRFTRPLYWRDPASGFGYQVQLEIPAARMDSVEAVGMVPVKKTAQGQVLVRDVADLRASKIPGQIDRYNMKRLVSLSANLSGEDLGRVADRVDRAIQAAGEVPAGMTVEVRGQVVPMRQMFQGLAVGLVLAVVVIVLLLTAYFQSVRLSLVVMSTAPAVLGGVFAALVLTRTTLNIQSFMGAIMAIGVAVANAILLVTFAERARREGADAADAAVDGGKHRLRPILMTSCAMIAGMLPMALGRGEGGEQTAPLARAVIGGLGAATLTTLLVLPCVFAIVQGLWRGRGSASLDPDDPESSFYDHAPDRDGRAGEIVPVAERGIV